MVLKILEVEKVLDIKRRVASGCQVIVDQLDRFLVIGDLDGLLLFFDHCLFDIAIVIVRRKPKECSSYK